LLAFPVSGDIITSMGSPAESYLANGC